MCSYAHVIRIAIILNCVDVVCKVGAMYEGWESGLSFVHDMKPRSLKLKNLGCSIQKGYKYVKD
jgi:hypothetical protein